VLTRRLHLPHDIDLSGGTGAASAASPAGAAQQAAAAPKP
jgi:hypothetical protein